MERHRGARIHLHRSERCDNGVDLSGLVTQHLPLARAPLSDLKLDLLSDSQELRASQNLSQSGGISADLELQYMDPHVSKTVRAEYGVEKEQTQELRS